MSRCQSCNKFASLQFEEPEVESLELDGSLVTATVRLSRTSECCGDEVKEASLEMSTNLDFSTEEFKKHVDTDGQPLNEEHELEVREEGVEQIEEGGGRYKKSYFGAAVQFSILCACDGDPLYEGEMHDKIAASEMEETG